MRTEWKRVVEAAVEQGWRLEPTTDGWQLKAPDGVGLVTIHNTPSDHRAIQNAISRMRRSGFQWPPPKRT